MDRFWSGATGLSFGDHLRTDTAHSAQDVVDAWHRAVGYGVNLVVNFVPRPGGDLPAAEVAGFGRAGEFLRRMYAHDVPRGATVTASGAAPGRSAQNGLDGDPATFWQASEGSARAWLEVDLGRAARFDRVSSMNGLASTTAASSRRISTARNRSGPGLGACRRANRVTFREPQDHLDPHDIFLAPRLLPHPTPSTATRGRHGGPVLAIRSIPDL